MEKSDIFGLHAELCKTLSNPKRLMILALLAKKEMSVGEIAEVIAVPPSNVSQHLSLLKAQSLVHTRKERQTVYYSLADRRIIAACTLIRSVLLDKMKERGQVARDIGPRYVVTAVCAALGIQSDEVGGERCCHWRQHNRGSSDGSNILGEEGTHEEVRFRNGTFRVISDAVGPGIRCGIFPRR